MCFGLLLQVGNTTLTKLIFAGIIQYFNNKGETVKVESFSDAFYKPDGLYESGMLDHIFRGMIKSHTQVRILIIKYLVGCSDLTFELK